MWSRTHGFYSHRFIPLFCVLNRSLVLSSVGSPIPLLTLSHGALLRLGLISSVASSTGAVYYPTVVFLSPMTHSITAQPMFLHVPVVYQHTLSRGPDTQQNLLKWSSSYNCCPWVITCWYIILDHQAPFSDINYNATLIDNILDGLQLNIIWNIIWEQHQLICWG